MDVKPMNRRMMAAILSVVFVDLLGFSLVLPLLPFFAKEFGASDTVNGLLVASYAAAQFFGAPLLGRTSDRYGRRPVLLVSIFGTAVGFVMLGVAGSLLMLFGSRILDGLTGGNISVAQAYISDITDKEQRARGLGLVGAAFGVGFIIGPVVGGVLSNVGDGMVLGGGAINWQFALPAFAAAALAAVNLFAVYLWLPESLPVGARSTLKKRPEDEFTLRRLRHVFALPRVGPLLTTRLLFALAFSMFHTVFALYASSRLGLGASETAFVLAYVGVLIVVVQGGLMGRLTTRFDEYRLVWVSLFVMSASLLAWSVTPSVPVLLVVMIPMSVSGGVLTTVINSLLTKVVHAEEVGGILGISASLESLTRVISPIVGGVLLDSLGTWSPGLVSGTMTALVGVYFGRRVLKERDTIAPVPVPIPPLPESAD